MRDTDRRPRAARTRPRRLPHLGEAILVLALVLVAPPGARAHDHVVPITSGDGFLGPQIENLSGDGRVAVGHDLFVQGFRWEDGALLPIPELPGVEYATADLVSHDGSVVIGSAHDGNAWFSSYLWTASDGAALLPVPEGLVVAGISGDGATLVALGDDTVYRGPLEGEWAPVGDLDGFSVYQPVASADAEVVAGTASKAFEGTQAFRWTAWTGLVGLGTLPDHESSSGWGISADGSVVVGSAWDEDTGTSQAFRWDASEGMVALGRLPGTLRARPVDASADGSVVVGFCTSPDGVEQTGFVWTEETGMLPLEAFLATRRAFLSTPIAKPDVVAVSDDGLVLAVVDQTSSTSYLVRLVPQVHALPGAGPWVLALALLALGRARARGSLER